MIAKVRACAYTCNKVDDVDNKGEIVIYQTYDGITQLDVRERFATVSAAVSDRRKDLTKITTDQIAYKV